MTVALVRWFKFLLPTHIEEYSQNLRDYVDAHATFLCSDDPVSMLESARQAHCVALDLQKLYGCGVLPKELLECINGSLTDMTITVDEDQVAPHTESQHLARVFCCLQKVLFTLNEKPVVTRFWLFGSSVDTLLRLSLLRLPMRKITQTGSNLRKSTQKRMTGFLNFFEDKGTPLSGPLNRLNAILSLLHPLDRYRTHSAIGSAIGRPLSHPISHPNTGGSPQPPRSKPLRGLNRAIVAL